MGINLSRQKSSHDLLAGARKVAHDLSVVELIEESVRKQEGVLSDTGALCVTTGKHTGRSPKDKFIVDTPAVHELISWTNNTPCSEDTFNRLYAKMKKYGEDHQLYVTDVYAGADIENRLQVKFINEFAWQHLFIKQLFIKPEKKPSEK
jgi:phosphoenolpyruvate carboxykinase (ATP)